MSSVSNHSVTDASLFDRHLKVEEESKRSSPFVQEKEVDRKAGKISFNIFNSQPIHLLSKAVIYGGLGALAVVCLPSAVVIVTPAIFTTFISLASLTIPVVPVVTSVAATLFIGEILRKRKELRYELSLFYAWSQNQDWWTPLKCQSVEVGLPFTPFNIILGAIPLDNHLERLYRDEKIGAMITLLEEFETKPGLFNPADLGHQQSTIDYLYINAKDFGGVPTDQINRCIQFIENEERCGKITYIHCKSGRGRSAVIALSYLLKKYCEKHAGQKIDFEVAYREVHAFVKEKRPRINLNANQKAAVEAYYKELVKEKQGV